MLASTIQFTNNNQPHPTHTTNRCTQTMVRPETTHAKRVFPQNLNSVPTTTHPNLGADHDS